MATRGYGRDVLNRIKPTVHNGPFADRDQILHQLRGLKEREHRCGAINSVLLDASFFRWTGKKYKPLAMKDSSDSDKLYNRVLFYNKSVMIYTLDPKQEADSLGEGILTFLDIWLYRQWFQPYQSDIDFGRYIAKTLLLQWKEESQKPTLDDINRFHKGLCHDLSGAMFQGLPLDILEDLPAHHLKQLKGPYLTEEDILTAFNQSCIVQPTFQSFFIVLQRTHGFTECRVRADDIGNIPVLLVCTDCHDEFHSREKSNDNLGPCCSIQTTMKAAIRFIMDLEKNHTTVRKPLPSRVMNVYGDYVDIQQEAEKMGWDPNKHGKLPLDRPCSTWVDRRKYTEWTGAGAAHHALQVVAAVKCLWVARRNVEMEDYWWWHDYESETTDTRMYRLKLMFVLAYAALGTVLALGVITFWLLCWVGWIEEEINMSMSLVN